MILDEIITSNINNNKDFFIRKDANLTLETPIAISRHEYQVKGALVQYKINVKKEYDYIYDNLDNFEVTGLTICNKFGRVQFPGTINIREVDF